MGELTEKHHAYIVAKFYQLLTEHFGERGEAAFVLATQRYAEQRGSRMAQRAIRDGKPLTFATYREYGEWISTQSTINEGCDNRSKIVSYSPDLEEQVIQCPWATQFKEMEMQTAGTLYCIHLDKAIVRGFNPYLVFEVPQSMHEHDYCIQISREANLPDGIVIQKHPEYLRSFDYHCGHVFQTFSKISAVIFDGDGEAVGGEVLRCFGGRYSAEMADVLAGYENTNFNYI